jgi:putative phosphoribosyl transferase
MTRDSVLWKDRRAAGLELAERLRPWAQQALTTTVIGLPRGGVAVAAAVAERLQLPLASCSVRKLALPAAPEYALGALAGQGVVVWNPASWGPARLSEGQRQALVDAARPELERRRQRFADPEPSSLRGRSLIVVDDGIATGMTVLAALQALRRCEPAELVLAVPVLDQRLVSELSPLVDALVAVAIVNGLRAVGDYYDDFSQVSDRMVELLLQTKKSTADGGARGIS